MNTMDDLAKYNQENVDAAMRSIGIMSKGLQAITASAVDYSKKSIQQSTDALEKLLGARSLERAMEVQSDYLKASYESFIAESNRVSELCAEMTKEVYRPFEPYISKLPSFAMPQQGMSS